MEIPCDACDQYDLGNGLKRIETFLQAAGFYDNRLDRIDQGHPTSISENICSEDDLRSGIFGTFVVKFLTCLSLLGFLNI